jgi:D-alanyl-D-alanine carboxypeptidase/D-alanyl-D-alanine-endopeptidase (penicillin-binding protein 4)
VRRFVLPVLLVLIAVGCGLAAFMVDEREAEQAEVDEQPEQPAAITPLLSPRRVPEWLLEPKADERLALGVQPVIDQSPADTCLVVSEDGRRIVDQRADLAVVPASNIKLVTAVAALEVLGADTTFRTTVEAAAPPADGVIGGDLWLVGGGDPVLSTADYVGGFDHEPAFTSMEALADRIVEAGVTTIEGDVLGDDTRYDGLDTVPDRPPRDAGTRTAGPFDALAVNRGYTSYATSPDQNEFVPQPSSDAPGLAAATLVDLLEERGVTVGGSGSTGTAPEDAVEVAGIDSPPMTAVVSTMLTESDNTISELLLKEMAVHEGQPGSSAAGVEVMRSTAAGWGLPDEGVVIADGSGMDGDNRLTCQFVIALLEDLGRDSTVVEGLPIGGERGTLLDRLTGPAAGRIHAKTGTLLESIALSGYADTLAGEDLAFSYIANAPEVPEDVLDLQELLATVLIAYPEGPPVDELAPEPVP